MRGPSVPGELLEEDANDGDGGGTEDAEEDGVHGGSLGKAARPQNQSGFRWPLMGLLQGCQVGSHCCRQAG